MTMSSAPVRFSRMRHLGIVVTIIGVVSGVVLIVTGLTDAARADWVWPVTAGAIVIGGSLGVLVVTRLALKVESNSSRLYGATLELHEKLDAFQQALTAIAENTLLSDAAKSIVSRTKEREALRRVISEEIRKEDFESVFHLIDDLEQRLGYRDEAESLRQETRDECAEAFRAKLQAALEHVNKLLADRRWGQAGREIERLEKLMPNEPRVRDLWALLERRRDEYKQQLMAEWNKAVAEGNVERGIALLGELDQYLGSDEAKSLQSTAREFYKERLQQFGVQFQFAVKEKRWRDALGVALQIIEEYPNARMSTELRERLNVLRSRAGIPTDVDVTARAASPTTGTP